MISKRGGENQMETFERRREIMKIMCRRRYETMPNLASELGVSTRTIQRDIESLSLTEPIYTQVGKYGGGVYVVDGYYIDRMYMADEEVRVLEKLYLFATEENTKLTVEEISLLKYIILQYSKPKK